MEGLNKEGFIQWMKPLHQPEDFTLGRQAQKKSEESGFAGVFQTAWKNAVDSRTDYAREQYALAVGETDNPHNLMIVANKAELSVELLVQLRNKALESYDQLIKIGF